MLYSLSFEFCSSFGPFNIKSYFAYCCSKEVRGTSEAILILQVCMLFYHAATLIYILAPGFDLCFEL